MPGRLEFNCQGALKGAGVGELIPKQRLIVVPCEKLRQQVAVVRCLRPALTWSRPCRSVRHSTETLG
jgi:hypothetical protein